MFAMYSLSNSKFKNVKIATILFEINNYFILLTKYFSLTCKSFFHDIR